MQGGEGQAHTQCPHHTLIQCPVPTHVPALCASQVRAAGYTLSEIKAAGYTCKEVRVANYTCAEASAVAQAARKARARVEAILADVLHPGAAALWHDVTAQTMWPWAEVLRPGAIGLWQGTTTHSAWLWAEVLQPGAIGLWQGTITHSAWLWAEVLQPGAIGLWQGTITHSAWLWAEVLQRAEVEVVKKYQAKLDQAKEEQAKLSAELAKQKAAAKVQGGTILYHQTDSHTANIIIKTQHMKPGTLGLAGGGIYFATTKELTGHKAHKHGVILEATVSLGRILTLESSGDSSMTLSKLKNLGFDSTCISRPVHSGHEYVVYDSKRVLSIRKAR